MPPKKKNKVKEVVAVPGQNIKMTVKECDMPDEMAGESLKVIKQSMIDNATSKAMATKIKAQFDEKYPGTTWHCIVGAHYGVSIRHATNHLIFVSCTEGERAENVLVFKSQE